MVCHICSQPASMECPYCKRYCCPKHTVEDVEEGHGVHRGCAACRDENRRLKKEFEQRVETSREEGTRCAFCGGRDPEFATSQEYVKGWQHTVYGKGAVLFEKVLLLPECRKCGSRFCSRHGQIVTQRDVGPNNFLVWHRCQDHLVKKGKFGRFQAGTFSFGYPSRGDFES